MNKTKSILANMQFVKNVRDGRQTQHRTPFSKKLMDTMRLAAEIGEISYFMDNGCLRPNDEAYILDFCKRQPGDILYVRETFAQLMTQFNKPPTLMPILYKADSDKMVFDAGCNWRLSDYKIKWKPSIHMPKWAARTFLKVKRVWVERVQDISDNDAMNEGISLEEAMSYCCSDGFIAGFSKLWESIYPGSWERNDWVECCEFELIDKPLCMEK